MAKVLLVCGTTFCLNVFLKPQINDLLKLGHEVHVYTDGEDVDSDIEDKIDVFRTKFPRSLNLFRFFSSIFELRAHILNEGYDLISGNNRNASIVSRVATSLVKLENKHVINVYTARGFYFHDDQSKVAWYITYLLEIVLSWITDHTLSQTREDIKTITRHARKTQRKITFIGNGINQYKFCKSDNRAGNEMELGLRSDTFRICTVGRIVKGKGIFDLIDAFNIFEREHKGSFELLIIGGNIDQDIDPLELEMLDMLTDKEYDGKIKITGMTDSVERYLQVSDLFVLPSYREGMPRSLLEAMSVELPVLASNIRGARELVSNEFGILFAPKDVEEMCKGIKAIWDLKPPQREAMGRAGREIVLKEFNEEMYVSRQRKAISELLS